ncbi:MAG TPA: N-acetyltransferase [Solirubrobacteraceae bacterium]|nr:N-acetyltransferase [Solirubrobacteraceae bacterium]
MKLRPPRIEDAGATAQVIAARSEADLGVVEITSATLRDEWGLSEIDLGANARLVEDETDRVIGYGILRDVGAYAVISPNAEGSGAGSLLLDWLEQRSRELGRSVHRQLVASTNQTGSALLSARGYRLAWSEHRMVRPLAGGIVIRDVDGVTVRPLEFSDLEAIHAVDGRAFAGDPGYVPESLAKFREAHLEAHDSAPGLSRVALAGDRVAGFLIARRWENRSTGYVDLLAVDPDHHGRGIGHALLLDAFTAFAAAGLTEAQLSVSSVNPRALALYRSAGMTPRFRHDIYQRPT